MKIKAFRYCIITTLTTILIIGLNQFTYAQGWYNTGGTWNYRKAITASGGTSPYTFSVDGTTFLTPSPLNSTTRVFNGLLPNNRTG